MHLAPKRFFFAEINLFVIRSISTKQKLNFVQSSIFCALARFRKYPQKRRHFVSRRSFGENGSSGYCYCKTLCWTFYPADWGWGGSRVARKPKLPASHTYYPWLMSLQFPSGSCVFVQNLYCKISWKVAMFGFFSPLRKPTSLHPVPLPPPTCYSSKTKHYLSIN